MSASVFEQVNPEIFDDNKALANVYAERFVAVGLLSPGNKLETAAMWKKQFDQLDATAATNGAEVILKGPLPRRIGLLSPWAQKAFRNGLLRKSPIDDWIHPNYIRILLGWGDFGNLAEADLDLTFAVLGYCEQDGEVLIDRKGFVVDGRSGGWTEKQEAAQILSDRLVGDALLVGQDLWDWAQSLKCLLGIPVLQGLPLDLDWTDLVGTDPIEIKGADGNTTARLCPRGYVRPNGEVYSRLVDDDPFSLFGARVFLAG